MPAPTKAADMLLRRMGIADYHTHGFRSIFKDWAAEQTGYPLAISEMALAHDIGSETEKSYRRTDFFDKRIELMQAWADDCGSAHTPAEPTKPADPEVKPVAGQRRPAP